MGKINLDSIQSQKLIDWVKRYFINQKIEHVKKIVHQALSLEDVPSLEKGSIPLNLHQAISIFYNAEIGSDEEKNAVIKCIHLASTNEDDLVDLFDQVFLVYLLHRTEGDDNFELKLAIRKVAQFFLK